MVYIARKTALGSQIGRYRTHSWSGKWNRMELFFIYLAVSVNPEGHLIYISTNV